MKYAALIDAEGEVQQVIVIFPDRDPVAEASKLGGTWVDAGEGAAPRAGRGLVHHAGEFYPRWRQIAGADTGPEGAESGYPAGYKIWRDGKVWVSTVDFNVWAPGTSGWREDGAAPAWRQPRGAHDAYQRGDEVTHEGAVWRSTHDANVWAPGVFGWERPRDE